MDVEEVDTGHRQPSITIWIWNLICLHKPGHVPWHPLDTDWEEPCAPSVCRISPTSWLSPNLPRRLLEKLRTDRAMLSTARHGLAPNPSMLCVTKQALALQFHASFLNHWMSCGSIISRLLPSYEHAQVQIVSFRPPSRDLGMTRQSRIYLHRCLAKLLPPCWIFAVFL